MEPRLLVLGLFTSVTVPACRTEMCLYNPPEVRYATFKALEYKNGTMLNCDCKTGFRRVNRLSYMTCLGNSSWNYKCRCVSISNSNTGKQVPRGPEEDRGRKTTTVQNPTQPVEQADLAGHCREPPPWEHEGSERIYHFMVGQAVHYQCMPGYKALHTGPATSICKMSHGTTVWTQPRIKCTDGGTHRQPQGEEEAQASTDPPVQSATPCPVTTADSQQLTEAATTAETFVLAVEHQIAVAGCVFLLIGILLLSGLTWQWRWKKSRRPI